MNDVPLLGKKAAQVLRGLPALGKYTLHMPNSPFETDYSLALKNLGQMGNDKLGDCTCAAIGHAIQTWTSLTSQEEVIPDDVIINLYSAVSGYVPGDPLSDQGAVATDALKYWYRNPVQGHHSLSGFANIRPGNRSSVRDAVYLFGVAYIGVQLPLTAQKGDWDVSPDSDLTGDDAPGSWGGHAIPIVQYDKDSVRFISWGKFKDASWNWLDAYMDEGYALLSKDWLNKSGRAPPGFDFETLTNDMMAIKAGA